MAPESNETVERASREEQRRLLEERAGSYPIEGEDLISLIGEAEVGKGGDISEFKWAFREAMAFREGLVFGSEEYDLDNNNTVIYLNNLFTTVETSTTRPRSDYIDAAIRESVGRKIREVRIYDKNPRLWERRTRQKIERELELEALRIARYGPLVAGEEGEQGTEGVEPKAKPASTKESRINEELDKEKRRIENIRLAKDELLKLAEHADARRLVDEAFVQRMGTCENDEAAANLLSRDRSYKPPVTPDKGHWEAFFRGDQEWGNAVNEVFWEIVKFGRPDEEARKVGRDPIPPEVRKEVGPAIYAKGFKDVRQFRTWLKHLYVKSGNRMDVVWNAWKLALTWEVVNEFGVYTVLDEKGEKKYELADPPLGNALFTWTAHLEVKRRYEFGIGPDGRRTQVAKYISHTGLPMSLGKFPALCRDYLHEAKLDFEGEKKTNLFKVAWNKGISFADTRFPWAQTEATAGAPGELGSGSFGLWLLNRFRAFNVVADIRMVPDNPNSIANPDFFAKRIRNWEKVLGKLDDSTPPENNPRTWWVAGLIYYFLGGTAKRTELTDQDRERDYRTIAKGLLLYERRESLEARPSVGDILRHARICNFLRQEDVDWILKKLRLKLT